MDFPFPTHQSPQNYPSSAFHSATQSSLSSATPDSPTPSSSQSNTTHLPPDPPLSFRPLPSSGSRCSPAKSLGSSDLERQLDPTSLLARVRSCDVYLGLRGRAPGLLRLARWLRSELEMQGVACFVADRGRCRDARSHALAAGAMDAAAFGVVLVTPGSLSDPYSVEEIRFFSERRKLVPIFFGVSKVECRVRDIIERRGELWERYGGELWSSYGGIEEDWAKAVRGLARTDVKLEASSGNFRDCILEAVMVLEMGLGRRSVAERVKRFKDSGNGEFPFPRNPKFVGRKKELLQLELMLFGDVNTDGKDEHIEITNRNRCGRDSGAMRERVEKQYEERSKGKKPMGWKESEEGIEVHGISIRESLAHGRKNSSTELLYRKGIACVCGDSGIGKTELLLEFAYKFSQQYKMVLWIGGEARYIRQNYMKLLPLLGVDLAVENDLSLERNESRSFEDMEEEAIRKVRKELVRDIPFLLVIDNLESEKDWWDGRSVMELLPRFGRETHVLISTRLPRIINIEPLRLPFLSSSEAMALMKGSRTYPKTEDIGALELIEEKLGRLPLGLALVGAILSELPMSPSKLLDAIKRVPYRELTWNSKEDVVLKHNPFFIQLLEVCFSIFDHAEKPKKLATRMVHASGWFAPAPIPISMLVLAAIEAPRKHHGSHFWTKLARKFTCTHMPSSVETTEDKVEAAFMLVKLCMARSSTRKGCLFFHDIIKLYVRKKNNGGIAPSMVRAISIQGSISEHLEHIWAACFLLFKFHKDAVVVDLSVPDLISFIKRFVLPLALHCFSAFSRCNAVLELLRLSTEALEAHEDSFISKAKHAESSSCLQTFSPRAAIQFDPLLYQDFPHLRATLLETRAKLMIRGGLYDTGERLCRTAMNIKDVIYGWEHPETLSTRETMEQLIRLQSKF